MSLCQNGPRPSPERLQQGCAIKAAGARAQRDRPLALRRPLSSSPTGPSSSSLSPSTPPPVAMLPLLTVARALRVLPDLLVVVDVGRLLRRQRRAAADLFCGGQPFRRRQSVAVGEAGVWLVGGPTNGVRVRPRQRARRVARDDDSQGGGFFSAAAPPRRAVRRCPRCCCLSCRRSPLPPSPPPLLHSHRPVDRVHVGAGLARVAQAVGGLDCF